MAIKYRKSLAIIGTAFLTLFVLAPSHGASTQNSSPVGSVETMGTIHVINTVINDNGGTKLPSDFIFTVKHWGTDVVGSPFAGANGSGVTFVVVPGSYVVSTPVIDGYLGSWSGEGTVAGLVMLEAGQVVTITRTSEDVGPFGPYEVYVPIDIPTDENGGNDPTTEDGGTLPNTSSPWFNYLVAGLLISAAGAVGLRKSRVLS
ncbi:MAG: LPXTG cell wall anchor domain-containing protein [Candidatus Planktophila sp.]|nr:LPXTG cell wall anchor domain-containing protein [Candidatus Planktophila sp.]